MEQPVAVRTMRDTGLPPRPRPELVAATRNVDKLALLAALAGRHHSIVPLPIGIEAIEPEPEPVTRFQPELLAGIAQSKAISVSVALNGALTIASDGGLLVPGLGDRWQPARTRRFVGANATNRDRAVALLAISAGLSGNQRRLGWREVVAIAGAGRLVATFTAEATPGWLGQTPPADWDDEGQGFWVPRLWLADTSESVPIPGAGTDHWDRLALLVGPFLDGLAVRDAL